MPQEAPTSVPDATPASGNANLQDGRKTTSSKKTRKYFSEVQPTFTLQAPPTQLEFLDHSDPSKDKVVRKKAREYVNRNKDRRRTGSIARPAAATIVGLPGSGSRHVQFPATRAPTDVVHRRFGPFRKGSVGAIPPWMTPPNSDFSQFDPFKVLPDVGRPVDHIIEFCECPNILVLCQIAKAILISHVYWQWSIRSPHSAP